MLTILVGNLAPAARAAEVRALFAPFGTVRALRLIADIATGDCRGLGYVEMDGAEARAAMAALDGTLFMERALRITPESGGDGPGPDVVNAGAAPGPDDRPATRAITPAAAMIPVFAVDSVEAAEAPSGGRGDGWHRYVLKSERSAITGMRRGSREQVRDYASQVAEQLNTRAALCKPSWNPRGRKPAARSG